MTMTEKIKERPILFSAPMVNAILEGRKTQARRVVKPQPHIDNSGNFCCAGSNWGQDIDGMPFTKHFIKEMCRHGQRGDHLWVRETWQTHCDMDGVTPRDLPHDAAIQYPATYDGWVSKRRPSIFMPRWASRITLKVTDVRVERLQDISTEDAIAEGIIKLQGGNEDQWMDYPIGSSAAGWLEPINSFETLWASVNGSDSWDENPFVYAISFERVEE